jgi:hypothetical protein
MIKLLLWVGRLGGVSGVVLVVAAVLWRLSGHWRIGNMSVGTLLLGGVAAIMVAVLAYAAFLAERPQS